METNTATEKKIPPMHCTKGTFYLFEVIQDKKILQFILRSAAFHLDILGL